MTPGAASAEPDFRSKFRSYTLDRRSPATGDLYLIPRSAQQPDFTHAVMSGHEVEAAADSGTQLSNYDFMRKLLPSTPFPAEGVTRRLRAPQRAKRERESRSEVSGPLIDRATAAWLASDPIYTDDSWLDVPQDLPPLLVSADASPDVPAPRYVAPSVSEEHVHRWKWAGSVSRVSDQMPLPHWDAARCIDPTILRCNSCGLIALKPCGSHDVSACAPCELRYRKQVRTVAREPVMIAKPGTVFLLTLTAPGEVPHCKTHTYWDANGREHASVDCIRTGRCRSSCECTNEEHALTSHARKAEWNRTAVARWNDLVTDYRRHIQGLKGMEYFRAAEVQQRGVLHFHVLFIVKEGLFVVDPNDTGEWARVNRPATLGLLRKYAIRHGFGHEIDLERVGASEDDHIKAARYVAKYVSKSNAEDQTRIARPVALPGVAVDAAVPSTGLVPEAELLHDALASGAVDEHARTVPYLFQRTRSRPFRFRTWSVSRGWGLTLARVRRQQIFWAVFSPENLARQQARLAHGGMDPAACSPT